MDILDHLTQEHRKAEQLMEQLAATDPGDERDRLVAELTDALSTHMAVEERFLYPIVQDVDAESEEEAEIEHGLAREGLSKLDELKGQPGFAAALDMVKAGVAHHVEDEESEVFPELRAKAADRLQGLDPDELEQQVRSEGAATTSRSAPSGDVDLTKEELYQKAQEADIPGRSSMTKDELAKAVAEAT